MPTLTAYLEKLHDGDESFEAFVRRCAHSMLMCMCDCELDEPIPEKVLPSLDFHFEEIGRATETIREISGWDGRYAEAQAVAHYEEQLRLIAENTEKSKECIARYNRMLDRVKAWIPPTPDHYILKAHMITQLESGIIYEQMKKENRFNPQVLVGAAYKEWLLNNAEKSIADSFREIEGEKERAKRQTDFITALNASFNPK